MRPAVRIARRAAALPTQEGEELPPTELVAASTVTAKVGTVFGGGANTLAGAAAALGDASDATGISDDFYAEVTVGFASPAQAGGRSIDSFTIIGRWEAVNGIFNDPGAYNVGPEVTPDLDTTAYGSGLEQGTLGPFTGPLTVSEFEALTATVYMDGDQSRLTYVAAELTYGA